MNVDVLTTKVNDGIEVITLGTESVLARMRSYEEKKIISPSSSFEV
jgi:hypothetical protein